MSDAERQHPRYAHEVAVVVRAGNSVVEGRTRNVSRGGLCANVDAAFATGTDVIVDIVLVFADDQQSEALRLPGRIAWCTTVDEGHQVGVSFRPLRAEQLEYLSLFLKYLDHGRTEKQPRAATVDERFR